MDGSFISHMENIVRYSNGRWTARKEVAGNKHTCKSYHIVCG
jgi:hypothetical protein